MFEKEAEENLVEQLGFDKGFIEQEVNKLKNPNNKFMVDALIREVKYAYQKGAEHGYYKAKVEVEDSYRESLCNSELNLASVTEQLEELEKANEWHYVKDRLPKELHDVLCFVIHNEHRYSLQGYLRDGRWVLSPLGTYLNNEDVIAWKEIVLPKEV